MINIVFLIALAAVEISIVFCRPQILANNEFLKVFVSHEVLSLLAVVLTVTVASVANIHLAVNKIVADRFSGNIMAINLASEIKSELRQNCLIISAAFVVALVLLIWKGSYPSDDTVLAVVHAAVIWIVFLYLAAMFDVYRVVFGFADLGSAPVGDGEIAPTEGAGQG